MSISNKNGKTALIQLIELLRQESIQELLSQKGSLRELGKELGVSHTTIANWVRALERVASNSEDGDTNQTS